MNSALLSSPLRASLRIILLSLTLGVVGLRAQTGYETWSSSSGHEVVAKFVSYDPETETVTLERQDGQQVKVPAKVLTKESQDRVQLLSRQQAVSQMDSYRSQLAVPQEAPPPKLFLSKTPQLKQLGNGYAVPVSAAMIANEHGLTVDQRSLNQYAASDPASVIGKATEALTSLGFTFETRRWNAGQTVSDQFYQNEIQFIRSCLTAYGPMLATFKPGTQGTVDGVSVIVGYNEETKELLFYSPSGDRFTATYDEFMGNGISVTAFAQSKTANLSPEEIITKITEKIDKLPSSFAEMLPLTKTAGGHMLLAGSKNHLKDQKEMQRWASRNGWDFLQENLKASPVLMLPRSDRDGKPDGWYCIYHDKGKERGPLLSQLLTEKGWQKPMGFNVNDVLPRWPTNIEAGTGERWDLPLILFTGQ